MRPGSSRVPSRLAALVTHKHHALLLSEGYLRRSGTSISNSSGSGKSRFGLLLSSTHRIALDLYQVTSLGHRQGEVGAGAAALLLHADRVRPSNLSQTRHQTAAARHEYTTRSPFFKLPYHRMVNPWTLGAVLHEVKPQTHKATWVSRGRCRWPSRGRSCAPGWADAVARCLGPLEPQERGHTLPDSCSVARASSPR